MDLLDNNNYKDFQKKIKEYENMDLTNLNNDQNIKDEIDFEEIITIDIKEDGMYQKKS